MKLITRDIDYAVRALCFIAKQKENVISVSDLVKNLRIPQAFLRKILQILNSEGILESYKGQGGGFILGRKPEKIFLVDLIRIFHGSLDLNECLFKKKPCSQKDVCPLKKKIDAIEEKVILELKLITIGSLLKEGSRALWQKEK